MSGRSRMVFPKPGCVSTRRFLSCSSSLIGEKAIVYLKRHPEMLRSLSPDFSPEAASYVLVSSQSDQRTLVNFLKWAEAQAQAQDLLTPQCKCLALHLLSRLKLFSRAHALAATLPDLSAAELFGHLLDTHHLCHAPSSAAFDLVVKSLSRLRSPHKALSLLRLANRHGFSLSVLSYNAILHALLSLHSSFSHAQRFFLEMLQNGVSPNVYTYNLIIRALASRAHFHTAFAFLRHMQNQGISPNVVTYNTLIHAHCKNRNVNHAIHLLRAMPATGVSPNLISYNSVLNGLCAEGRMREVHELVHDMATNGFLPDAVTYNTLVNGFCKDGNFHHACLLLSDMLGKGLSPNVVTYTTLIHSMCKAGNLIRAIHIFYQMRFRGLWPNERTYTTIIDGFCRQGFMYEAYKVLSQMIVTGFSPSIVTYNALVHGYCFLGRIEDSVGILRRMLERGLSPDVVSYSTVIAGFCRERELVKAFQMKEEMVEKGVLPDAVTYSSLIQGLCLQHKLVEAFDLFQEMVLRGLPPDEFTYTSLINAYCIQGELSKAIRLHDEMMHKGFLPDDVTYSVLINGLNKKARTKEAKRLLLKLFYEESVPNDVTYNTLIQNCCNNEFKTVVGLVKGFCMKGLMNEADRVFKTMLRRSHKPNATIYNLLIHGHCRSGNVRKAYDLYLELERGGFVSHTVTVIALTKALAREGMNDELSRVLQNVLRSSKLNEAEGAKVLVDINFKDGNMDAVLNVLTEMAKDGLLPDSGMHSYAPANLTLISLSFETTNVNKYPASIGDNEQCMCIRVLLGIGERWLRTQFAIAWEVYHVEILLDFVQAGIDQVMHIFGSVTMCFFFEIDSNAILQSSISLGPCRRQRGSRYTIRAVLEALELVKGAGNSEGVLLYARSLISRVTEERNSVIDQIKRLLQELISCGCKLQLGIG
ncbi:hypothetical protein VNO78_09766 [Psophocarpus tetragonolobus]|uniref:Pentatricopeptide repeat-containing protein n=1 Tax=Psophocarpus tetragonolobus TaxID=3891 RepID=A0AAN9SZP9_PSOTE